MTKDGSVDDLPAAKAAAAERYRAGLSQKFQSAASLGVMGEKCFGRQQRLAECRDFEFVGTRE